MTTRLEELGTDVASAIDEALVDTARRNAVLKRLKADERVVRTSTSPPRARTVSWAAGIGFAAAAAAVLFVWLGSTPAPLTYAVAGEGLPRTDDAPILAAKSAVDVRFSDASIVRLSPGSRAHVEQLDSRGASVALDQGTVAVNVPHRAETRWEVRAGPYRVRVTGTRFHVDWDPTERRFGLRVTEGSVRLTGPDMVERTVRGGESVDRSPEEREASAAVDPPAPEDEASGEGTTAAAHPSTSGRPSSSGAPAPLPPSWRPPEPSSSKPLRVRPPPKAPPTPASPLPIEKAADDARPPAASPPAEVLVAPESAATPEPASAPEPAAAPENEPEEPEWSALLRNGEYEMALRRLDGSAISDATWRATATQLLGLGAAARRLGDPRAGSFYAALRSRFPGSDSSADAAFMLARMSFHRRSYASAATWLETYLRERPEGRFARDASGRLIEVYRELDDPRLEDTARGYLARHPNGPHAALAREALQ